MLKNYLNNDAKYDKITFLAILSILGTLGGIYGFIYEIIFYYLNSGMTTLYWRGSCFGPWITIYALGSFLIYFVSYRFRKNPLLVILTGGLSCGIFEFLSGVILYYGFNGHRGWDYNTERWNFGNIGGFICLRSVIVFALSSLILIYVLLPFIFYIERIINRKLFLIVAFSLGALFILDIIYNLVFAPRISFLITANDFYKKAGFHIMGY